MKFDFEVTTLSTGGVATAIYNFIQGDHVQVVMGILVSISVIALNIAKILKLRRDKNNGKEEL